MNRENLLEIELLVSEDERRLENLEYEFFSDPHSDYRPSRRSDEELARVLSILDEIEGGSDR